MKTFETLNSLSKKSALFAALIGAAVFFNSCKNDIDQTSPAIAAITVVNAYPDANPLDFYMGGTKVNNTGIAFGQKINYFEAYEGARSVNVTTAGSLTSLLTKSITLKGGFYHSLFIIGKAPADLDFLVLQDNFVPNAEKVNLRFVNLSPDAAALSMEVVGDTTKFENKAYKDFTPFKTVVPVKANIVLKDKATNTVKATLEAISLEKGKIYTIWAKGLETTTADANKLTLQVTQH
jgi:hypothetical protein